MRISYLDIISGQRRIETHATVTTNHPAAEDAKEPVILDENGVVSALCWVLLDYRIHSADNVEKCLLRRMGFDI